jgi:hypothetical protein
MPIRADRSWQILTEVGVGPCPAESATRPMEKVSHSGDGHFWYLRSAICEREEALRLPTYTKGGKARYTSVDGERCLLSLSKWRYTRLGTVSVKVDIGTKERARFDLLSCPMTVRPVLDKTIVSVIPAA